MARREAEDTPGVVTGTVSLCDHAAYALFDPGALHSFISEQFVELSGIEPKSLDVMLYVATPLNDKVLIALGCPDCKIVIDDKEGRIDLAVLCMHDFDVIIGMDWLVKQKAIMDCSSRVIQFNPARHPRFQFMGNRGGTSIPWILLLEVTKLLDGGCQGYLVTMVDSSIEEPRLENIAKVCNFSYVFP